MKIKFAGPTLPRSGVLVIFAAEGGQRLGAAAAAADARTKGQVGKAIKAADFAAKRDNRSISWRPAAASTGSSSVGLGEPDKLSPPMSKCWAAPSPAPCSR